MSRKEIEINDVTVRIVPRDKRYAVSKCGRVFSRAVGGWEDRISPQWRELKQTLSGGGKQRKYLYVCLGAKYRTGVHQLVMLVFAGKPRLGQEVRHLDGDPKNNHLINLAYGTKLENSADAKRHGTTPRGTKNPQSILTPKEVRAIREMRASGKTCAAVGAAFGVSLEAVSQIARGTRWGWLE